MRHGEETTVLFADEEAMGLETENEDAVCTPWGPVRGLCIQTFLACPTFPRDTQREAASGSQLLAVGVAVLRRRGSSFSSLWPHFMALVLALSAGSESRVDSLELRVSVGAPLVLLLGPSDSSSHGVKTMFRDCRGKNLRENRNESPIVNVFSFCGFIFSRGIVFSKMRLSETATDHEQTCFTAPQGMLRCTYCTCSLAVQPPPIFELCIIYVSEWEKESETVLSLYTARFRGPSGCSVHAEEKGILPRAESRRVRRLERRFLGFFPETFQFFRDRGGPLFLRERSARVREVSAQGALRVLSKLIFLSRSLG
uniref:Uncharacterized protein n=1 Tax=Toxoplasma gondii COUG TaxID=1074873 RepID=A0A2G8XR58_TOXGO|nr:hypothetical protein TGCOUG_318380 [Toxoplasma gondii COUG]